MNSIEKVCEILNISIGQVFQIQFFKHKNPYKTLYYKITESGLRCDGRADGNFAGKSNALEGLILGKHKVVIMQ